MNKSNGITLEEALERLAKKANITADDMKFYIEDNVNEPYKSLYEYKAIKQALTELAEIKQRAEEKLVPITEREKRFERLFVPVTSNSVFITAEDEKFVQNYVYGDGEKDAETKELIDYIIKGETK